VSWDSGIDHRSRRPPCSWFSRVNGPPRALRPVPEVGQPTAPGVVAEPDPIIADIDGQLVRVSADRYAQCRCLSMTSHIGHGFPNDSLDIGDKTRVHECVERSRPRELELNPKNWFEVIDDRLEAAAEPVVGHRLMEVEDRTADLSDSLPSSSTACVNRARIADSFACAAVLCRPRPTAKSRWTT
jgi:hypothetical protein